jgi:hypothetical protein
LHVFPLNGIPARVFIANATGQMVFDQYYQPLEDEPILLNLRGYAQGIYTVYVRAEGQREQVERLVVQQP